MIEVLQEQTFQHEPAECYDDRRENECNPIAHAGVVQQHPCGEGAHHVLGAVREVDDVEHAEDERQAETHHRIERAVDRAEQQQAEQCLRGYAEDLEHVCGAFAGRPRRSSSASES